MRSIAFVVLFPQGQILKDPQTLESYGLSDGHVVHMVKSKPPPASGSSPAAAATPAGATSTPSATSQPANTSALFDAAGLPGLGNISEEQIQGMMNNPMMQSILNNPQLLRQMLESNPLFQRMARDHPEMQAMLDDPSALSNMMRSMADPVRFFPLRLPLDLLLIVHSIDLKEDGPSCHCRNCLADGPSNRWTSRGLMGFGMISEIFTSLNESRAVC